VWAAGSHVGRGLDAQGAAEGMLIASALDSLTSKTQAETLINIYSRDAALFLFYGQGEPETVRRELAEVQSRIDDARKSRC
jgi:hypothetical protein